MHYGAYVGAICMVSLVAFMVYATNIGCGCVDPEDERLTVQIGSPAVSARASGDEVFWDATLPILKVTPKDEKALWVEMRVIVKSADGDVLNMATQPQPYDPSATTDNGVGIADVQFWFKVAPSGSKVSAGDTVYITGMNALQYEGALVQLMKDGKIIGSTVLPTNFP